MDNHTSWNFMLQALQYNRTMGIPASVAQYNDQPSLHEAFEPFNKEKEAQKETLQPAANTAPVKMQENGIVLTGNCSDSFEAKGYMQHYINCLSSPA